MLKDLERRIQSGKEQEAFHIAAQNTEILASAINQTIVPVLCTASSKMSDELIDLRANIEKKNTLLREITTAMAAYVREADLDGNLSALQYVLSTSR